MRSAECSNCSVCADIDILPNRVVARGWDPLA